MRRRGALVGTTAILAVALTAGTGTLTAVLAVAAIGAPRLPRILLRSTYTLTTPSAPLSSDLAPANEISFSYRAEVE